MHTLTDFNKPLKSPLTTTTYSLPDSLVYKLKRLNIDPTTVSGYNNKLKDHPLGIVPQAPQGLILLDSCNLDEEIEISSHLFMTLN